MNNGEIDVSSGNSFKVDERLLPRSFIFIRKNSGYKIEPWDTAASAGDHQDVWPFKITCWNLLLKKLLVSFKGVPENFGPGNPPSPVR